VESNSKPPVESERIGMMRSSAWKCDACGATSYFTCKCSGDDDIRGPFLILPPRKKADRRWHNLYGWVEYNDA
jgi:hypothetical protein